MHQLILDSKGCVWRPLRFQQDSVQKDGWDLLMMSARDISEERGPCLCLSSLPGEKGKEDCGDIRFLFRLMRYLAVGWEREHRREPGLQRVSAASSHGSVESKSLARCSGTSRCKVWEMGGVRRPGNANGEEQERRWE